MELSDLVLKQIGRSEYNKLYINWYENGLLSGRKNKFEIIKPFIFFNYRFLLEEFLLNHDADMISIHDNSRWNKFYSRKVKGKDLTPLLDLITSNPKKIGHLELYFSGRICGFGKDDRILMKFAEKNELIIGFYLQFPSRDRHYFSWISEPDLVDNTYSGLFNPKNISLNH